MKKNTLYGLVLALAMLGMTNVASAATYTFGPVTTAAPITQPWEDGIPGDSNESNNGSWGFFGVTDWAQITKIDTPTAGLYNDGTLSISTSNRKTGTWSFLPSLWTTYNSIVLVLKDGGVPSGSPTAIFYTAWLLQQGTSSGTWTMPDRELSHMSLYGSITGTTDEVPPPPIPVPAAVWLFGSGLAGLIASARRKSKTAIQA